ncbi:MAG: hypothetical protein JXJ20_00145 [Anaerolineae bacterium]|nr:hypothetical protein [Anaerolineae bacterium]
MLQPKRITSWLSAALLSAALTLPMLTPSTPVAASHLVSPKRAPSITNDVTSAHDIVTAAQAWVDGVAPEMAHRPPVDPAQQAQTTASWTVMVYLAADNNLDAAAMRDLNEMEGAGSSPDVNILVQIDRSAEESDDWTESRRYYVQPDEDVWTVNSPVMQNLGEVNSGDPNTIADFAIWGITNYPAQRYMLVLWDHGGGWTSHASDDDTGDDMTLLELSAALERAVTDTGIGQFDVVGFDMCLMGQFEVYETIAPYAHYGIGSEDNEPNAGWFYLFLQELVANPTLDGAQVAAHVVDYFMAFLDEYDPYDAYGLGAVDLGQAGTMVGALDAFTAVIRANPQAALSAIADARNNAMSYGGFDDPQYYDIWSSVDLYGFANLLNSISASPDVQGAAQGIMQAVDSLVIHEGHSDPLEGSNGVSIYFPRSREAYKKNAFNEHYPLQAPQSMAGWIEFLDLFHGTATDTVTAAPSVSVISVYPDVSDIYQPAVVMLEVSGRDILQVNYAVTRIISENERVVLDFDYLVSRATTPDGSSYVDWPDGVTTRTFAWDAEVPVLTDGSASTYALLIPNRENPAVATVNGEYIPARGGDRVEAQLVFDLNARQATALWGLNETASGALQPYQIDIQPGDQFQPVLLTMDANNDLAGTGYGETLVIGGDQPVRFDKQPAPSGSYAISFAAENVAGVSSVDEIIIQVNNEGLDPVLRGYTDLTFGVNFRYPANWLRPRFTPDGQRLYTADLATNTLMTLFPYTGVTTAEETAAAVKESWSDLADLVVQNERDVQIGDLPAYVADYTYSFNGQPRVGAVIAIYVPVQGVGYGFDLDAPAETPEPATQALQVLVDSINFFEPTEIVGESAWQVVTLAEGQVMFSVPASWVQETGENWVLYGPATNPAVFVGLATAPASGQTREQLAQSWIDQLQASVTNLEILASEPYYVGNREWHLVVFVYDDQVKMAGAFFVTTDGQNDYTFWLEAPDADFDQIYADVFSVTVDGFAFGG